MRVKKLGTVLELDPKKQEYILVVKKGSVLEIEARDGHIEIANGRIFFVGSITESKFVENSNRITSVEVKK